MMRSFVAMTVGVNLVATGLGGTRLATKGKQNLFPFSEVPTRCLACSLVRCCCTSGCEWLSCCFQASRSRAKFDGILLANLDQKRLSSLLNCSQDMHMYTHKLTRDQTHAYTRRRRRRRSVCVLPSLSLSLTYAHVLNCMHVFD